MKAFRNLSLSLFAAAGMAAAADPALLNLIMPDARTVAGIDVERARGSAFGRFVLSQMQRENPELHRFIGATGFDPRRDLREIIIASASDNPRSHKGLVLARGNFNTQRIVEFVKGERGQVQRFMGVDLLSGPEGKHGAVAFLDATTAVAGDTNDVMALIQRHRAGTVLDSRVAHKMQQISGQHDLWVSTAVPVSSFANRMPDPNISGAMKGDVLKSIEEANGGIRFGAANVEVSGEAVTRSDKDATALADVLRFLANMVQMNRDNQQAGELAKVLDTMELRTEANVMKFSVSIPEDQIEKLMQPRNRRRSAAI
jgi:hypothetical protein